MKRKLAISRLKGWINENEPNGLLKLAVASQVSISTLDKMVRHKYNSSLNQRTMDALCKAMELPIDDVFPMQRKAK